MKILVVDDEKLLVKGITFNLQNEGYEVEAAYDGVTAVDLARRESFDLIILDWMMPGKSGSEACMEIRTFSDVPVIMLTAKGTEYDKVLGLDAGADDYVAKPFGMMELLARIKALLRRTEEEHVERDYSLGGLYVCPVKHIVRVDGQNVTLTLKEFDLLRALMRSEGRVLSRSRLLEDVWGVTYVGETRTVDVHIQTLRQKLNAASSGADELIRTVRGVGYTMKSAS